MKKQAIHFVVIYSVLACYIIGGILYFTVFQQPSAADIFNRHMQTVVEVKAYDDPQEAAFGSAVFVNSDGLLVTNAHVISYTRLGNEYVFTNIYIRFATSEEFIKAEFVNKDTALDIATLQVNPQGLSIRPARTRATTVIEGERVYAIGNAQNHGISIIQGIVSNRKVHIQTGGRDIMAIQVSNMITQGNSGGALVDARGNLVGITTFRLRDSGGNTIYGISFAIPVNRVQELLTN